MTMLKRDIIIGLLFVAGIAGFVSGDFIVSTIFFAWAAIYSNLFLSKTSETFIENT